jgi:hypothetical protein
MGARSEELIPFINVGLKGMLGWFQSRACHHFIVYFFNVSCCKELQSTHDISA